MFRSLTGSSAGFPIVAFFLAALSLVTTGALVGITFWSVNARPSERVSQGITVADVPVGGISRDEVRDLVQSRLERYEQASIALKTPDGARRYSARDLGYRVELAATLAEIEALGVAPERETLLADWTGESTPRTIRPAFSIDEQRLAAVADGLAASIDREPVNADLRVKPDTSIELIASRPGQRLARAELTRRVQAAFRALGTEVDVPIEPVTPPFSDIDAEQARRSAEQFVAGTLDVTAGDRRWTLTRGDLASWIIFRKSPSGGPGLEFDLHPERPRNWLVDRAAEVNRPARDARFRIVQGKLTVTEREEPGQQLDRAGSFAALKAVASRPERTVALPIQTLAPRVAAADAGKLAFPDLLAEASTVYGGGIPERNHNVELATARLDGTVVPPGATFSFNQSVGRTRLKDGYKLGFGILASGDDVQTVPSVAGGICQVATTLFHSVFWTGLPIGERHSHPYWIPKYGTPPKGMTGLDATVDEDSGLDFQFTNTTEAPLLIQSSTDGSRVTFQIRGARPSWTVSSSGPSLSNFVKADPTFVRQEDPSIPVGRALQIEEARDGFDAIVTRTVTRGDAVIDRLDVKSHYAPSRNVVLVGSRR